MAAEARLGHRRHAVLRHRRCGAHEHRVEIAALHRCPGKHAALAPAPGVVGVEPREAHEVGARHELRADRLGPSANLGLLGIGGVLRVLHEDVPRTELTVQPAHALAPALPLAAQLVAVLRRPRRHLRRVVVVHQGAVEVQVEAHEAHRHLVVRALVVAPEVLVGEGHARADDLAHALGEHLAHHRLPQVGHGAPEHAPRDALELREVELVADAAAGGGRHVHATRLNAEDRLRADADGGVEPAIAELLVHHVVGDADAEALGLVREELPLDEAVEGALTHRPGHRGVLFRGAHDPGDRVDRRDEVALAQRAAVHLRGIRDLQPALLATLRARPPSDAEDGGDGRHQHDEEEGVGVSTKSFQHREIARIRRPLARWVCRTEGPALTQRRGV